MITQIAASKPMEMPKLLALAAIALGYMLTDQATRCAPQRRTT